MRTSSTTSKKKSIWDTDARPKGLSPDDVLLGWLKQAGNFDRFMRADSDAKRAGRIHESKIDVARDLLKLLQNAGFEEFIASEIVVRLSLWTKKYRTARELDRTGGKNRAGDDLSYAHVYIADRNQVEQAFRYYFDLVEYIQTGNATSTDSPDSPIPSSRMSPTHDYEHFRTPRESPALGDGPLPKALCDVSGENIIQLRRQRRPVARYTAQDAITHVTGGRSHIQQQPPPSRNVTAGAYPPINIQSSRQHNYPENISRLIEQHHVQTNHILDMHDRQMNRLVDQYQDLISELSRSHRHQQMQMQTSLTISLIDRMKDAGYSNEDIADSIKHLQQQSNGD